MNAQTQIPVVVVPGDGIGPAITDSVKSLLVAAGAPLQFIDHKMGKDASPAEIDAAMNAFEKYGVLLKGPTETPIATEGKKSFNVTSRKGHGLFINFRRSQSFEPVIRTHFPAQDITVFRENEEGLYAAIEHRLTPDSVQALSIKSYTGMHKIIRAAFEYALEHKKSLCCMHKGNILKKTEGSFLEVFQKMALEYPSVKTSSQIIDDGMAKVATQPGAYQVIVTENLFGDILSDVTTGLTGSLGLGGSSNIGLHGAMFEAIHGTGPQIVPGGKDNPTDQHIANPSGLLQAALLMLDYLGKQPQRSEEQKRLCLTARSHLQLAWLSVLEMGVHTKDLALLRDGKPNPTTQKVVNTREFTSAVLGELKKIEQGQGTPLRHLERLVGSTQSKSTTDFETWKRAKPFTHLNPKQRTVGMDLFLFWTGWEHPKTLKFFEKILGYTIEDYFVRASFHTVQEWFDFARWLEQGLRSEAREPTVQQFLERSGLQNELTLLAPKFLALKPIDAAQALSRTGSSHRALVAWVAQSLGEPLRKICVENGCELEMISNRGQSVYPYIMNPDLIDQMRCRIRVTPHDDDTVAEKKLTRLLGVLESKGYRRIKSEGCFEFFDSSKNLWVLGFGESYGQGMGSQVHEITQIVQP